MKNIVFKEAPPKFNQEFLIVSKGYCPNFNNLGKVTFQKGGNKMKDFDEEELDIACSTIFEYLGQPGIFHTKSGNEYFIMIRSKNIDEFLASHGIRIRNNTKED